MFSSSHLLILVAVLAMYALSIWALTVTIRSDQLMTIEKVIWSLILILVPGIGLLVWALLWFTRRWPRHTV
ncbi:PLDc N-terminal domain-containing protein [Microbacterium schleiferi]|uniref:PLDc N-terminal domain-containing protein n=1 Tax=Microbacterium schleiferi TaxID=69362 RepID=A0A7S8MUW5_9MICO|nr:PLDc N-terminal domain-containing protein [Microbacterium schleiferi]QPE03582.1 PLDc N-terminal domain-containing protein [Microbacterium schleiferi]